MSCPSSSDSSSCSQSKSGRGKDGKPRVLCLHGFRTSGSILSIQMAAFCYNVGLDGLFPDAPFPALGEPDPGIAQFYGGKQYHEWYCQINGDINMATTQKDHSIRQLVDLISGSGHFDGILGFSQGAAMATLLLHHYQDTLKTPPPFGFAILIGGVDPSAFVEQPQLSLPSLHLVGDQDSYRYRSLRLAQWFKNSRTLSYNEGHNIPSIRTGIYPDVQAWIREHLK